MATWIILEQTSTITDDAVNTCNSNIYFIEETKIGVYKNLFIKL